MNDLVISIRNYSRDNYREIINNIKKVGFKNVFIEWYNDDLFLQESILDYVREVGLNVIFAHLGYQNTNVIWKNNVDGDKETKRYINDIDVCKSKGIDLVIIHPTGDFGEPEMNQFGLNRIRKIIEHAEEKNMKVAFENVELKGYLEYIVNNIDSENLGICFDAGHCALFFDGEFATEVFKNKVFAIHLHDNHKEYDEHNLPFDGNVNWDRTIRQIIDMNYNGYIIIESGYNDFYANMTIEEYYKRAYEIGTKLIDLFNSYEK